MSIKAVVFDLDDTLYPEIDYVKSGFSEVGKQLEKRFGIKSAYQKLFDFFRIDKNDVYGRLLRDCKISFNESDIDDLIEIYRTHKPKLTLSCEVKETLSTLSLKGLKLGIITDGRPHQQWAKIQALDLDKLVDKIIVTDELGGIEFRKPNPIAFEKMCIEFNIQPSDMVYVGDNPKKDFAVKKYLPIKTVQIMSGLYQNEEYLDGFKPNILIDYLPNLLGIDFNKI